MRRILPQPLMTLALVAAWLLAHNSLAPGLVLVGIAFGVLIPLFTARFWPEYPRTVRYGRLLRFIGVVLFDILIANVRVAWLILGPSDRIRPYFIEIPVDTDNPYVITLLASVISLTPGTVSANLSGDRRTLLVHGLDIRHPEHAVRDIKRRYEAPLKEIFAC